MREKGSRREAEIRAILTDTRAGDEIWQPANPADKLFYPFFLPPTIPTSPARTSELRAAYFEARLLEAADFRRRREGPRTFHEDDENFEYVLKRTEEHWSQ